MNESTPAASELYRLARRAQSNGDTETAKSKFLEVLKLQPEHADALHSLGNIDATEGRLEDGERLIRKAIELEPLKAAFINSLGNVLKARGRLEEAEAVYRQAIQLRPDLGAAHNNLAELMLRAGKHQEAVDACLAALRADPNFAGAYNTMGRALNNMGRLDEAADVFRRAVIIRPDFAPAYDNLGHVMRAKGDMDEARDAFEHALAIRPDLASAQHNLATVLMVKGELDKAIEAFEKARDLRPRHIPTLVNLAVAFHTRGNFKRAAQTYRAAINVEPDNPQLHLNLGLVRVEERRSDAAEQSFRKVQELDPDNVQVHAELAALYEETNRIDELEETLGRGLELSPGHPRLNLEAAKADRRADRIQEGIARLEAFDLERLDSRLAEQFHYELGYLHDRAGTADTAFTHFREANRIASETVRAKRARPDRFLAVLDNISGFFRDTDVSAWTSTPPVERKSPVFMFGFPRSGTTLLDVALDSHPGITTVEEHSTIIPVLELLGQMPGGFPANIAGLGDDAIRDLRSVYFSELDKAAAPEDERCVIDKMPIRTVYAGIIWRLFPDAKFIFCLRHPCDVVLSNFMQHYTVSDSFSNFYTLEGAARLYDKVMSLWQVYRQRLPLDYHVARYEGLVADFRAEVGSVLTYLGLPWDESVLSYAERAMDRGRINTNSYHQVTQPIYKRSKDRWRAYEAQLRPLMAHLQRHIENFGYGD
jgi:tetratricopeptide (TPR) repeat protein